MIVLVTPSTCLTPPMSTYHFIYSKIPPLFAISSSSWDLSQSVSFRLPFSQEMTRETETSFNGTEPIQPGNGICNLTAQINTQVLSEKKKTSLFHPRLSHTEQTHWLNYLGGRQVICLNKNITNVR